MRPSSRDELYGMCRTAQQEHAQGGDVYVLFVCVMPFVHENLRARLVPNPALHELQKRMVQRVCQ